MKLRFDSAYELNIYEVVVTIKTADGTEEEFFLSPSSIEDNYVLEVGVVGQKDDMLLVEMPRQSSSGRHRIWVRANEVSC